MTGGSFVIGDLDGLVGRKVTFWGAQWAKANSLSGGSAPSSFKGFANATNPNPTNCDGIWTSGTGNTSAQPPSVPQFITVIAASSITQSGSAINGNIQRIVIVQTDPGYDGGLDNPGTGTVTQVVCISTANAEGATNSLIVKTGLWWLLTLMNAT
jgi:hypothetical protein